MGRETFFPKFHGTFRGHGQSFLRCKFRADPPEPFGLREGHGHAGMHGKHGFFRRPGEQGEPGKIVLQLEKPCEKKGFFRSFEFPPDSFPAPLLFPPCGNGKKTAPFPQRLVPEPRGNGLFHAAVDDAPAAPRAFPSPDHGGYQEFSPADQGELLRFRPGVFGRTLPALKAFPRRCHKKQILQGKGCGEAGAHGDYAFGDERTSIMALQKAGRSSGQRLETRFLSTTTGASSQSPPALTISSRMAP